MATGFIVEHSPSVFLCVLCGSRFCILKWIRNPESFMKKVVEREKNKNYYRVFHVPIWIWVFWILPGHLTADLYAHGPDRRHWIWLAIVTSVCIGEDSPDAFPEATQALHHALR